MCKPDILLTTQACPCVPNACVDARRVTRCAVCKEASVSKSAAVTKTWKRLSSRNETTQVLNQATSLDGLKKSEGYPGSLVEHFYAVFGPKDSEGFKVAQRRFACSLAG